MVPGSRERDDQEPIRVGESGAVVKGVWMKGPAKAPVVFLLLLGAVLSVVTLLTLLFELLF